MIKASFYRDGDGMRLTIDGHAGYGYRGTDIVCAAVSGIFFALVGYLYNLKRGEITVNAIEDGHADICCGNGCEEALKLACIGLCQVESTYPGYVKVNNRLWNWKIERSA